MTKLLCILLSTLSALCPALCDDQVIRNANGRIVATISETANGHTIRNCDGIIIGRIQDTANGKTVRDENERIIGMIESRGSADRK